MIAKDEAWFQSVSWTKSCLECQSETGGVCSNRSCAKLAYDENGNYIRPSEITYDGDYKPLSPKAELSKNKDVW